MVFPVYILAPVNVSVPAVKAMAPKPLMVPTKVSLVAFVIVRILLPSTTLANVLVPPKLLIEASFVAIDMSNIPFTIRSAELAILPTPPNFKTLPVLMVVIPV